MEFPKVTVIIPIYNVEQYLSNCIESLLQQSYIDFELLLVNDGSSDNSGKICDEYAHIDSRIKVFHKSNSGASSARNWGIQKAKGEWIAFVDSDDVVLPDYLRDLISGIPKKNGAGMVYQGHTKVNIEGEMVSKWLVPTELLEVDQYWKMFAIHKLYIWGTPYSKLYNRSIIIDYNLRFNKDIHVAEDLLFMFDYIYYCDWISLIEGSNYLYNRFVPGSLSKRMNSFESELITYQMLRDSSLKLKNKFVIDDQYYEDWYKSLVGYIYRSLNVVYSGEYPIIKLRLQNINKIIDPFARFLIKKQVQSNSFTLWKFMDILLYNRFNLLYDMVRINLYKFYCRLNATTRF